MEHRRISGIGGAPAVGGGLNLRGRIVTMEKQAILVASFDPHLADVRKRALENAGYLVVPAADLIAVRSAWW